MVVVGDEEEEEEEEGGATAHTCMVRMLCSLSSSTWGWKRRWVARDTHLEICSQATGV